jgi:hypothetical protein
MKAVRVVSRIATGLYILSFVCLVLIAGALRVTAADKPPRAQMFDNITLIGSPLVLPPAQIAYGPEPELKQPVFLAMPAPAKKATARSAYGSRVAPSHLTDRMLGLLIEHADALMGCTENSPEEAELAALTDVIEAYERQRWPLGRIFGGKG